MTRSDRSLDVEILDASGAAYTVRMEQQPPGSTSETAPTAVTPSSPRDEVDRVVAAWERERPDLELAPMHVLSRVTRLARHLDKQRRSAFSAHHLESWEFDVLAALRRAGAPYQQSPGQLLKETLVTSGTMTNRVDRLATRGLVARANHPEDRRGVLVSLTAEGKTRVDAALKDLLDAEQDLLGACSPDQRDQLASLLSLLITPLDDASPKA